MEFQSNDFRPVEALHTADCTDNYQIAHKSHKHNPADYEPAPKKQGVGWRSLSFFSACFICPTLKLIFAVSWTVGTPFGSVHLLPRGEWSL